ncbi:hypothetical protein HPB48_027075 [Haemaphysalis longicornis]|uniref:Uncharacterized protein n=1 Tax=Haemaphysalis longicornis TaxID=44386 RepID=A0A9J6HCC2_HAELO|nr:hypothetical protein HPB48_027075 [Haemaphysalis longicornis]
MASDGTEPLSALAGTHPQHGPPVLIGVDKPRTSCDNSSIVALDRLSGNQEELLPSFLLRAFTQGVPTSSGPGGLFQDQGAACRAAPARAQLPSVGLGRRYRGAHLRGRSWDVVLASSAGIRHRCAVPWQAPHTVEQLCAGDDPVAAVVPPLPSLASTATSTDDEKASGPVCETTALIIPNPTREGRWCGAEQTVARELPNCMLGSLVTPAAPFLELPEGLPALLPEGVSRLTVRPPLINSFPA